MALSRFRLEQEKIATVSRHSPPFPSFLDRSRRVDRERERERALCLIFSPWTCHVAASNRQRPLVRGGSTVMSYRHCCSILNGNTGTLRVSATTIAQRRGLQRAHQGRMPPIDWLLSDGVLPRSGGPSYSACCRACSDAICMS